MRKCVCGECIKNACVFFLFFMWLKYATPTVVGATSACRAVKSARRLYACMIDTDIATAGFCRHCV